ncbi:MAG: aminotransferase class V-fold PLP-dependent enzyme [bacterium]|nr:aminotransferase class V-fold PLP-dependent enzyme [bacterium]
MPKNKRTYLDIAAGISGNPSSPHTEGRAARERLEAARLRIARLIEVKSDDVVFTSGATEANAIAILGSCRAASAFAKATADKRALTSKPHLLYLPSSHASIVENMKLAENDGADIEALPIKNCRIDCDALAKLLRPETILISMDAVCGETGVVWNTREVANVLKKARSRIRFSCSFGPREDLVSQSQRKPNSATGPCLHVDASQAVWTEKLPRAHFGADLMTLDASKVCETRGIGCLIAPRSIPLAPLYGGGPQERGLRPGSEAPDLATTFAEGLARAAEGRAHFCAEARAARAELIEAIRVGIPNVLFNEARDPSSAKAMQGKQAPHILNLSLPAQAGLPEYDTDYLVALLDEAGFAISTRSACETDPSRQGGAKADSRTGSRAVFALWGDAPRAASTLRISWGPATSGPALAQFSQALIKACAFIDSAGVA